MIPWHCVSIAVEMLEWGFPPFGWVVLEDWRKMVGPFPMENIHPIVVHFPIALYSTSLLLSILGMVARRPSMHRVALWNLVLGTLGALAAVWTGLGAEGTVKHSFEIHEVMEMHERFGIMTLGLGLVAVGWGLASRRWPLGWMRGMGLFIVAGLVGVMALTAHLGGRLVYEFGVGGIYGRRTASIEVVQSQHPSP
jgi:uncharacterized membrane protein